MKNVAISTVLALALGSSMAMADGILEEAFKNSTHERTVGLYTQFKKAKGSSENTGYSVAHTALGYETAPIHGVSVGVAAWGNAKLSDKNGAYGDEFQGDAIFHKAFIKYANEGLGEVAVGRKEVDLEWLGDYIEGIVGVATPREDLAIVAAWAKYQGVAGRSELKEFEKKNGNKGVYVLDVKYSPLEWLELNPYYYHATDMVKAPGIKATATLDVVEDVKSSTMIQYINVSVSGKGAEDGSVAQAEQGFEFFGANVALGYIKTDKKGGAAKIDTLGNQNPFEEGNQVYGTDAKTFYLSAGYEFEGVSVSALYGQTKYLSDGGEKMKEKELDLALGYSFVENLETEFIYANVKNDSDDDSYNVFKVAATYSF